MVSTSDDGALAAGYTYSYGAGNADAWLVKVDSSGQLDWNKTYGGTEDEIAISVQTTSDGGYATTGVTESFGAGSEDMWLVKVDANGQAEWNQTYGGIKNEQANGLLSITNGFILAGFTESFGSGGMDMWIVQTDISGNEVWNKTYGGGSDDWIFSLIPTINEGFALFGSTNSYGAGQSDMWLITIDRNGEEVWNRTYGGANDEFGYTLITCSDGGYLLGGRTSSFGAGGDDIWLIKVDGEGRAVWNQTYGGMFNEWIGSIIELPNGYILVGRTSSYGAGGEDIWLLQIDALGNVLLNQTFGGTNNEVAYAMVRTIDGDYFIIARVTDPTNPLVLTDLWILKISSRPASNTNDTIILMIIGGTISLIVFVWLGKRKTKTK
ncbi:MAG: hypothetical protein ACXAD7_07285 [Candidatus Kariarchaeaceae archaeon]|jgi:predicted secreted protein